MMKCYVLAADHVVRFTRPSGPVLHTASDQNWSQGRPGNEATRVSVTESILRKFPMPHKKWGACVPPSFPFSHSFLPTLEHILLMYMYCVCVMYYTSHTQHSLHMHTHHRLHSFFNICNALRGIGKRERERKKEKEERKMEDGGWRMNREGGGEKILSLSRYETESYL